MEDKTVVYSKQTGEKRVPVTVRIEWLPDGKINPTMYWMPDGCRYQVRHLYERTPLAFLKDRGVGIRVRVTGEWVEMPDRSSGHPFARHETYLYFADDKFNGRNFIDGRYGHAGKEYIPVTLDVFPDGDYEPIYFWVKGMRYKVERKIKVEPRGSLHAGGIGIWHKVEARLVNACDDEDPTPHKSVRRLAALYFEINKWFVSIKTAERNGV